MNGTYDSSDDDPDLDQVPNYLDDCPNAADPDQWDHGSDGVGDACDTDDGLINNVRFLSETTLSWDVEDGSTGYRVYRGMLGVAPRHGPVPVRQPSGSR